VQGVGYGVQGVGRSGYDQLLRSDQIIEITAELFSLFRKRIWKLTGFTVF